MNFLKKSFMEVLLEVDDVMVELRLAVKEAKMNNKHELKMIRVKMGPAFEEQYLRLNKDLGELCELKNNMEMEKAKMNKQRT